MRHPLAHGACAVRTTCCAGGRTFTEHRDREPVAYVVRQRPSGCSGRELPAPPPRWKDPLNIPTTHELAAFRAPALLACLELIEETDPPTVAEVVDQCQRRADARSCFNRREVERDRHAEYVRRYGSFRRASRTGNSRLERALVTKLC